MKTTILLAAIVVSGLIVSSTVRANDEIFSTLQSTVNRLPEVGLPSKYQSELIGLWNDMGKDINTLRNLGGDKKIPTEYKSSLQLTDEALRRVVYDKDLSPERKIVICRFSAKDLRAKREFADKNNEAPFDNITVTVKTVDGTKEIPDCYVWYVPAAWKDNPQKNQRFNERSSTTDGSLPPGYYTMWTELNSKRGKETPITVDDPTKKQKVDLDAPAGS